MSDSRRGSVEVTATDKWPLTKAEIAQHAMKDCERCKGDGLTPACFYDDHCSEYCPGVVICPCVRGERQPE